MHAPGEHSIFESVEAARGFARSREGEALRARLFVGNEIALSVSDLATAVAASASH